MSGAADIPVSRVEWKGAVRIIRSAFPPIDLFEDIADPADWPLLFPAQIDAMRDHIGRFRRGEIDLAAVRAEMLTAFPGDRINTILAML